MSKANPVAHIVAGPVLVASIIRMGNGRQKPVRWVVYWSSASERMGARTRPEGYSTLQEAEETAMSWAITHMRYAPHVLRVRPM